MKTGWLLAAFMSAYLGIAQAAPWQMPRFDVQEGRGGGGWRDRPDRPGGEGVERQGGGREGRQERRHDREERRERLNDDERRALHRDLDKANRELYRRFER